MIMFIFVEFTRLNFDVFDLLNIFYFYQLDVTEASECFFSNAGSSSSNSFGIEGSKSREGILAFKPGESSSVFY